MFRSLSKSCHKLMKEYSVDVKPKTPIKLYPANMVKTLDTDSLFEPNKKFEFWF
jgi:hypothetical protein